MTTITKEDVVNLREKTGAGLIDCKRALTESGGDFEEAVSILRKKGVASAAKKAGRSADEGIIAQSISEISLRFLMRSRKKYYLIQMLTWRLNERSRLGK